MTSPSQLWFHVLSTNCLSLLFSAKIFVLRILNLNKLEKHSKVIFFIALFGFPITTCIKATECLLVSSVLMLGLLTNSAVYSNKNGCQKSPYDNPAVVGQSLLNFCFISVLTILEKVHRPCCRSGVGRPKTFECKESLIKFVQVCLQ